MKQLVIIVFVFSLACFVFGDASDLGNAFHEFGNCEGGPIFVIGGRSGSTLAGQSEDTSGVLGKCLKIKNDFEGRIEGSTEQVDITYAGLSGNDVNFSFYLKGGPGDKYGSYPRFAFRREPYPTPGEVTNCNAFMEWTNTEWTFDNTWHQYRFVLTSLYWDWDTPVDFFIDDYFESTTQTIYLDEIVLRDLTPIDASDDYENVFASFGNCEAPIWTIPFSMNTQDLTCTETQIVEPSVVGNCVKLINNEIRDGVWDRIMASTVAVSTFLLNGNDAEFRFYYKLSGATGYGTKYPYVYLRQGAYDHDNNPYPPPTGCLHSACWSRSTDWPCRDEKLIKDDAWHLFKPCITDFDWHGGIDETAEMCVSFLGCDGCGNKSYFFIDEIYLVDICTPGTGECIVEDWGLF